MCVIWVRLNHDGKIPSVKDGLASLVTIIAKTTLNFFRSVVRIRCLGVDIDDSSFRTSVSFTS